MNKKEIKEAGHSMHAWATDLFPINRSLTGPGVRETLNYLKGIIPNLTIKSVPTGYQAFDWEVPKEWSVSEAYIENPKGERIVDFKNHNLHLMGYSTPVDEVMTLSELKKHLYTYEEQPEAIPYVTSYYKKRWGFCLTHNQFMSLKDGNYHVVIKSELKTGELNYGELIIEGDTKEEVFVSTYVCHPSMANNELSGPVVSTMLAKYVQELANRKFSYRFVFIPETIGSIVYLSKEGNELKKNVKAGFNVTCIGDERCYSYLPSRNGKTISDIVAKHVLKHIDPDFKKHTWLDRGSDERQYCSPGIDLPIATIMRSKYGTFPEYHSSLDDLNFVTPDGLLGGFNAIKSAIDVLEGDGHYMVKVLGEPQLGKRGLYPNVSKKNQHNESRLIVDVFSYCDGKHSVLDIAEILNRPFDEIHKKIKLLLLNNLISSC